MSRAFEIECRRAEVDSAVALALISQLNSELEAAYPEEGANHFRLDRAETRPGTGAFLIAYNGADALGCAALRRLPTAPQPFAPAGEVKRMYVRNAYRRHGVAASLLQALEREAALLGICHLLLETGTRQVAAVRFYERAGFATIPCFGEYADAPLSLCMAKSLQ